MRPRVCRAPVAPLIVSNLRTFYSEHRRTHCMALVLSGHEHAQVSERRLAGSAGCAFFSGAAAALEQASATARSAHALTQPSPSPPPPHLPSPPPPHLPPPPPQHRTCHPRRSPCRLLRTCLCAHATADPAQWLRWVSSLACTDAFTAVATVPSASRGSHRPRGNRGQGATRCATPCARCQCIIANGASTAVCAVGCNAVLTHESAKGAIAHAQHPRMR